MSKAPLPGLILVNLGHQSLEMLRLNMRIQSCAACPFLNKNEMAFQLEVMVQLIGNAPWFSPGLFHQLFV